MATFNNTTLPNNLYPVANATVSSNPFIVVFEPRDPTVSDVNYPIQKYWLNTALDRFWFLKNFTSSTGIVQANWIEIFPGGIPLVELTIDTSTAPGTNPVLPDINGNITITGGQVAAGTTANVIQTDATAADGPNKFSIEIQRSQATAISTIGANGVSHFDSGAFTVDSNGFVMLKGGTEAIDSIQVDAFTAPGTNPVLPNAAGLVIVTGGQVAAGTTTNVIRTDSLAANTYTIEVQRSQAVAVSTVGDNGVSHFNSAQFSVDANGFVSSLSPFTTFNYTLVTTVMSPYTVTATDFYIATDSTGGPITLRFPNSPTQFRMFIVKDMIGNDAVSNVSVTTVGGAVTFDGLTTYTMNSNYQAINLLFNGTSYEVW